MVGMMMNSESSIAASAKIEMPGGRTGDGMGYDEAFRAGRNTGQP